MILRHHTLLPFRPLRTFLVPMSKQRMVRDSFCTDSYIEKLSPDEKLLFIYLLTNPLCNVLGIYEIRAKRIGFETGYDVEVVENILERFERDKKILRHNDFIVLVNHLKNQSTNPSIIQGCQRIFDEMSDEIKLRVTGWVQAGLLNLTLLNLTLPNPTKPKSSEVSTEVSVATKSSNKEKYGEFNNVLMTAEEYLKLESLYGTDNTMALIEELSGYIESTGKRYKSHYATLLNWAKRKMQDHAKRQSYLPNKSTADFSK